LVGGGGVSFIRSSALGHPSWQRKSSDSNRKKENLKSQIVNVTREAVLGIIFLTAARQKYIDEVVSGVPFLVFNRETGRFDITEPDLNWDQIKLLSKSISKLRNEPPPSGWFSQIRLDEFSVGYYDKCIEYYAYERLNLGRLHQQTCWVRHAQQTYWLRRLQQPEIASFKLNKLAMLKQFAREEPSHITRSVYKACRGNRDLLRNLKIDNAGWIIFHGNICLYPTSFRKRLYYFLRDIYRQVKGIPEEDRVLGLIRSILEHGWDPKLARQPSGSVLGYSRTTKRYMGLCGRHRLAALRYLYSQGKISGGLLIDFPVITYPWDCWFQSRPHPDLPICDHCK